MNVGKMLVKALDWKMGRVDLLDARVWLVAFVVYGVLVFLAQMPVDFPEWLEGLIVFGGAALMGIAIFMAGRYEVIQDRATRLLAYFSLKEHVESLCSECGEKEIREGGEMGVRVHIVQEGEGLVAKYNGVRPWECPMGENASTIGGGHNA